MQQQGIVPNIITYNAVISACEKGKQPERALEILDKMQQQRIVPNIITYSALISACEKGKQPERALEIFDKMEEQSIAPDIITYNALISACERNGCCSSKLFLTPSTCMIGNIPVRLK